MRHFWIMIAGPYGGGAKSDQDRVANLAKLNKAALDVFNKGHIPIVGVNCALPLIAAAGGDKFDEIMMPLSLALIDRCDACLRIAGASVGADQEVQEFLRCGKPVFYSLDELPVGTGPVGLTLFVSFLR